MDKLVQYNSVVFWIKLKFVNVSKLTSCALKTLSVFTSGRLLFRACLLLSENSFERLYHIAYFEHDRLEEQVLKDSNMHLHEQFV